MFRFNRTTTSLELSIPLNVGQKTTTWLRAHVIMVIGIMLSAVAVYFFAYYLQNGIGLRYNDARSHLDIGRRVVEGLKPGLAQLGSVWLPLNHLLMVPLIWNDWMWHSGLAGAIWNMIGFVGTGLVIYLMLKELKVGIIGRLVGVAIFAANVNILYLQATAMTEVLLLFTMTTGCYYLLRWHTRDKVLDLIKSGFWIMLATLARYDGWFLLGFASMLVVRQIWAQGKGVLKLSELIGKMEGTLILFATLAAVGVAGWFAWNQLIFHDALYFILGPFSAHAQQQVMAAAGALPTRYNLMLSIKVYFYSLLYNAYTYPALLAAIGAFVMWRDKTLSRSAKWGTVALFAPLIFNIVALYLGFSVIYVQGISGDTWFNIRYGVMVIPTIAVCIGYLVDRSRAFRPLLVGSLIFILFFALANRDSVAIDDAMVGSSQKNVSEVSGYLSAHAKNQPGFILISAASHDAIIFSSGLPMSRFIHEGTGLYWTNALLYPDRWARWIVMRTYDNSDLTWKSVSKAPGFAKYHLVDHYPFADVYELDPQYLPLLNTTASIKNNK